MAATAGSIATEDLPSNLCDARAELFFAINELQPVANIKLHIDNVIRLGGDINTPYSEAAGDQFDYPLSPVEECIASDYIEALRVFLTLEPNRVEALPTAFGVSLLGTATIYGNTEIIQEILNHSLTQGVSVHHYFGTTILSTAIIGLPTRAILYEGQFSSKKLQEDLVAWWKGTNIGFIPAAPIHIRYMGPSAVKFLLNQGANPSTKSDDGVSPLELTTNPRFTRTIKDIEGVFRLPKSKFLRASAPTSSNPLGTFIFEKIIHGMGLPKREITITIEYDFTELAALLKAAAPENTGGLTELRDYHRLLDERARHREEKAKLEAQQIAIAAQLAELQAKQALHDEHVKAHKLALEETKEQAVWSQIKAGIAHLDAMANAKRAQEMAQRLESDAKGAMDAHASKVQRKEQLIEIAANPIQRAFVHNIALCLQSIFENAKDQGNPTGVKSERAKTNADSFASAVKAAGSAIPGANVACSLVSGAITMAVNGIERKKWKKIFESLPLEGGDEISVDIALELFNTFKPFLKKLELDSAGEKTAKELAIQFIAFFGKYLAKHEIDPRIGIADTLANAPLQNDAMKKHFTALVKQVDERLRVSAARTAGSTAAVSNENVVMSGAATAGRGRSSAVSAATPSAPR
jgi:hypothetical protein